MSGGNDKTIKVWREVDTGSWVCDRTLSGHGDWVRAVTIFNKRVNSGHGGHGGGDGGYGGRWLVSGADDDTVKVWNMSTSKNNV